MTRQEKFASKKVSATPAYDPHAIAVKWQNRWRLDKLYQIDLETAKQPYYCLMMFPYPSAEGLHIGNIYMQTGTDAFARFKHMQGFDVFEPMGLDAFGIHSENYALKIGRHPMEQGRLAQDNFYRQMEAAGTMIDWSKKLETTDPNYYKWTQWLFLQMFKHGLAVRKKARVNFCPSCRTVLADEQVIDSKCERCSSEVEKRDLEQWFFKITKYAKRLLENIQSLDWDEKIKTAQTNWIGESTGAEIDFQIPNTQFQVKVFTTRPDTLYGVTFLVIAPEHSLVQHVPRFKQEEVREYVKRSQNKSEQERLEVDKEKTGVFSGLNALHPLTGEQLPIWIAEYVLATYGTGAIMAVPAHDQRDYDFATKYKLPIKQVISSAHSGSNLKNAYLGEGEIINSGEWNGLKSVEDINKIVSDIVKKNIGQGKTTYHLRDWLISRQRYWGPPIPLIFCKSCAKKGKSWFSLQGLEHPIDWDAAGWYPVSDDQLPVLLPFIEDFKPLGTGISPLANHPEFYRVKCPQCGDEAKRETDVSDTFLDSAWYFLRYLATDLNDLPFPTRRLDEFGGLDKLGKIREEQIEKRNRFLPVTMYIGGAEHAVLHLLYARFTTMALHEMGYLDFEEPFSRFYAHGLIIKDGAKMSKSKGNVILPDPLINKFGIDTVRLYLRFLGPFEQGGDFRDTGIEGMHRFIRRIWSLFTRDLDNRSNEMSSIRLRMMHKTIKGVTEDMAGLRFNTSIAKLMSYYNFLIAQEVVYQVEAKVYLQLIAPFAPHVAEELWERIGEHYSVHQSIWPSYKEEYLVNKEVKIAVQVNGKVRDVLALSIEESQDKEKVIDLACKSDQVKRHLGDAKFKSDTVIYVPGRVLNFVI